MIPKTDSLLLKVVVILLSLAWIGLAARIIVVYGLSPLAIIGAAGLVALAVGLWRLRPAARSISKFLLGFVVVVDILGTFGPFFGLDHPAGEYGSGISWASVLAVHVPFVVVAIALFGVLDRFKSAFVPRAAPDPANPPAST